MAVPKVNEMLLQDLEEMGFPRSRATRALYYSGNKNLEDAIYWTIDHENDPNIDVMPLVDVDIDIDSPQSFPITEEIRIKAQKLREQEHKKKEEELKRLEREREKERIQAGKRLLEAKRIAEENARQRNLALRKAEKEEEKKARENVLQKLQQDKINRRSKHESILPIDGLANVRSSATTFEQQDKAGNDRDINRLNETSHYAGTADFKILQNPKPVSTIEKVDYLRECLRSLKRKHQAEHGRVRKAFETLSIYVRNVVKNPNEEKYRKIRLSNPLFQERVASLNGGVEFLELCGFERTGDFLYLPHEKADIALLNSAGAVLHSAITNPFFGLLNT